MILHSRSRLGYSEGATASAGMESKVRVPNFGRCLIPDTWFFSPAFHCGLLSLCKGISVAAWRAALAHFRSPRVSLGTRQAGLHMRTFTWWHHGNFLLFIQLLQPRIWRENQTNYNIVDKLTMATGTNAKKEREQRVVAAKEAVKAK